MRIGLDGIPLAFPRTGVGHYTFELARALASVSPEDKFELVCPSTFPPLVSDRLEKPANLNLVQVSVGPLTRHWWSVGLPRFLKARGLDLFHGTNYDVPLWNRCPTVLTVHDLSLLLYPDAHLKRSVRRARRRLPLMVKTATAVIVPSHAVQQDLASTLGLESKVVVVPEASRRHFSRSSATDANGIRKEFGIGETFILAVGTLEPRKNLTLLTKAFEEVVRLTSYADMQLVIAGGRGWLNDTLFESIEKSAVRNRIVLTDYLNDQQLRALYSACKLFVYPSLYEGFGLPPLEAMACGAPVIVSDIPALRETTGGNARLIDPHSVSDLSNNIIDLLVNENELERLSVAGCEWATKFSWEGTARQTLEIYRRVIRVEC